MRIDSRGNKEGVDAQFTPPNEKLAFRVRPEFGEIDYETIFIEPDLNVIDSLRDAKNLSALKLNLPNELKVQK